MSAAGQVTSFVTKLKGRQPVADGTMAFTFERPVGFNFKAGQTVDITLLNPAETDAEGNTRTFSLASAPGDPDLMITTRLRDSAFKRVLRNLPPGAAIRLDGPSGNFTLHNRASRPAVLLAGGIGITPFRSILRRSVQDHLPHVITLLYFNRRPEEAAFLSELQGLATENPHFHFVPVMTGEGPASGGWEGETGHLTAELLSRHVPDLAAPIYYLAGPPRMVADIHAALNQAGVDDDDIRAEEFAGY